MAAINQHQVQNCPFCAIAARAPRGLNRSVLSQYRHKRRKHNDANDGTDADDAAPPPLLVLPAPSAARLVYADRKVVAFLDRSPSAAQHLLVCPRVHVANVNTMIDAARQGRRLPLAAVADSGEDADATTTDSISPADLADHMRQVGEALLWQRSTLSSSLRSRRGENETRDGSGGESGGNGGSANAPSNFLFGFHVPPWRSVDHLHLHCIEPPFQPPGLAIKYQLEWLNWLPDDRLRARLRGGGDDGGEGRGGCCWPLLRRRPRGQGEGSGGSREPLVPPQP